MENIQIDFVPYPVKDMGKNKFEIENKWGVEGLSILKRNNGYNETKGEFDRHFLVDVEKEKVTIELLQAIIDLHDGDVEEAFLDAVECIENYYESVGWEFLSDPKP